MFCRIQKTSSDRNGLAHRRIPSQIVFARAGDTSARNKVRFLEILEYNLYSWLVEKRSVSLPKSIGQLRYCQTLDLELPNPPQGNVAVRLHRYGLIEFRAEFENDVEDIIGPQLIVRVTFLKIRRAGRFLLWGLC